MRRQPVAYWLVGTRLKAGRIVRVLADWEAPRAPIRALTGPSRFPQPRVGALIEHLRVHLASRFEELG